RRKQRWWMPAAILVLMGGLIAFIQFWPIPWEAAYQNLSTQAACVLTVLLLGVWFVFFSGRSLRLRLTLGGVALLAVVAFFGMFTLDGATGDVWLLFRWRWGLPAAYALKKLSPGAAPAGRDATVRPGDFPQFLGPDRNATVHGVVLDPDWAAHPPREIWRQ